MRMELARRSPPAFVGRAPEIEDLVRAFLQKRSRLTRRVYETDLRDFAAFLGEPSPTRAMDRLIQGGPAQANWLVLQYRQDMTARGLSSATRNRRLSTIRSALKLGRTLGLLTWTVEIEGEKIQPYRDTSGPGEGAYRKMLDAANVRDRAILRLLHDLGLRRGEVVELDLEHVDLEKGKLSILGKGRTEREFLTIPGPTVEALEAWIAERGEEPGPLFQARAKPWTGHRLTGEAVRLIVAASAKRAGIGHVRPHGLRHTGITTALERTNGNISKVARYSRHASIETVKRYDDNRRDVAGEVAALVASA